MRVLLVRACFDSELRAMPCYYIFLYRLLTCLLIFLHRLLSCPPDVCGGKYFRVWFGCSYAGRAYSMLST